jgi:polygalacturonase
MVKKAGEKGAAGKKSVAVRSSTAPDRVLPDSLAAFDIRKFGASSAENAGKAIQEAIDTCMAAGGGVVYIPPGQYRSGTIHLRSDLRVFIEAGATLLLSENASDMDKRALFYGENVDNVTIEGSGTVDGGARYEWRIDKTASKAGYPEAVRPFPASNAADLVLLVHCRDVRISGPAFLHSPSWAIHLAACERVTIDGVRIRSSTKEAVGSGGISPDGCRDVRISHCSIETGGDALALRSSDMYGAPISCRDIAMTNCRLSSSSAAIKCCEDNTTSIRNVTVDNCHLTDSNRGIAFLALDGGVVENVILSNLIIECARLDWFWEGRGDPFHFSARKRAGVKALPGRIRNVWIRNVMARGMGESAIMGHSDSWIEGVSLENVRLAVASDKTLKPPRSANALSVRRALALRLRDVEIVWEGPPAETWQSALVLEDVKDLEMDGLKTRQALDDSETPAVIAARVDGATMRNCKALEGTGIFLQFAGGETRGFVLTGNDLRRAKVPFTMAAEVNPKEVREH